MAKNVALEKRFLTSEELSSLTEAELYKYCFIEGKKEEWDTDFNKEIVNNIEKYESLKALSGVPLSYIKTKIDYQMSNWLPKGTKLNPRLLYSLQTILEKDEKHLREAGLTGTTNSHISDSCIALTTIINKAFEYTATAD